MKPISRHAFVRGLLAIVSMAVLATPSFAQHGPRIRIFANGDLVVDTALRDNDAVVARNLGNFLTRVAFTDTAKLKIRGSEAYPNRVILQGQFELQLAVNNDKSKEVPEPRLIVQFGELRLARSKTKQEQWFLTSDGVELIEKAVPEQKK